MFYRQDFVTCVVETLKSKGYGPKKAKEATDYFDRQSKIHEAAGLAPEDAAVRALTDTFTEVQYRVNERAKAARKNLSVMASNADRLQQGMTARTNVFKAFFGVGSDSRGNALAHAVMSSLEEDKRFNGVNAGSTFRIKRGQYWSNMEAVIGGLNKFSRGAFGRELGAAHHENVVRELYHAIGVGPATGDKAAADIAKGIISTQELMLTDFNNAGGTLRRLKDFILPQGHNDVRIAQNKARWLQVMHDYNDWTKVRWPDGNLVEPAERGSFLEHIWNTLRTDGATDINPSVGHGQGRALGNMLDKHRVLVLKDADSWIKYHDEFGNGGSVYDVVAGHIDSMAHKTAIVTHFGQNPRMMAKTFVQQGRKMAGDVGKLPDATKKDMRAVVDFNAVVKNRYEKMLQLVLHENPMNPHSAGAATILGASHLITSALLGSVPLISQFGDALNTVAVRLSNNEPLLAGLGYHMKAMGGIDTRAGTSGYKAAMHLAVQTGYVLDEQIMPTYAAERYSNVASYGPAWTKRVGDIGMRLSGLNRQTSIQRFTVQKEIMGHLFRQIDREFDQLDNKLVLQHYGITPAEWDVVRKRITPFEPRPDVHLIRPLDILDIAHADKEKMFLKFATMIDSESRDMVIGATTEATVMLRGATRPDTTAGAILHSFGMFKNYPVSIYNMYGRRLLAAPDTKSRLKFIAALGTGMIAAGALGVQMREISHLRKPMDMTNPRFWGKAILASGGLSIWGDFLFGGNAQGSTFEATAAGPLAGLASDIVDVTTGSTFKWIDGIETGDPYGGKWASKITEFFHRYNPVASNWWLRPILDREVFDQVQRLIDPVGARKRETAIVNRQKQSYGNDYFVPPGQHLFH